MTEAPFGSLPFVNPAWHGASPSADSATNAAALVAAAATGKAIQWEAGIFVIDPVEITLERGVCLAMRGHSRYGTKLLQATGGIKINISQGNTSLRAAAVSVDIDQITFIADADNVPYGLWINWVPWATITVTAGVPGAVGTGLTHSVTRCGFGAERRSNCYTAALRLDGVSDVLVDGCMFRQGTYTGSGIQFGHPGGADRVNSVNNKVRHCAIYGFEKGIEYLTPGEGLLAHHNTMICNCGIYVYWSGDVDEALEPQVQVLGGHINCSKYGVYIENWNDVHIADVLFYTEGSGTGIYCTRPLAAIDNACFNIHNNIFRVGGAGGANTVSAIVMAEQIGLAMINANLIVGYAGNSIRLLETTSGCRGANMSYRSAALFDGGAGNAVSIDNIAALQ